MKRINWIICAIALSLSLTTVNAQNLDTLKMQFMQAKTKKSKLQQQVRSMYAALFPGMSNDFKALNDKRNQSMMNIKAAERIFIEKTTEGKELYKKIDTLKKEIDKFRTAKDYKNLRKKSQLRNQLTTQISFKIMIAMRSGNADKNMAKAYRDFAITSENISKYQFNRIKDAPEAKDLVKKYEENQAKLEDIRKKGLAIIAAQKKQ